MNPIVSMGDPNLFGPLFSSPSWGNWRAVLKGAFSMPLSDAEQRIYEQATGRKTAPASLRELWIIAGRRAGKDSVAAFLALALACGRDWRAVLRPGERAHGMIICPDMRQGRIALDYMKAYLREIPTLNALVEDVLKQGIVFRNGIRIEIHSASYRSTRGYTVPFAILDEIGFFRSEDSAIPDTEILQALRPAMGTVPDALLIAISTPYARRGELWKMHQRFFGKEDQGVLVVKGPTQFFNPTVPERVIREAFEDDPVAAASEYGTLEDGITFRSDVETFISLDAVEACVIPGRRELPYSGEFRYVGFVDPSGGGADSFTLAIAHKERGGRVVLDAVRERRPPFSPESAVAEFSGLLRSYRIATVHGDRYAGEWPREQFRKQGIEYKPAEKTKGEFYIDLLPILNSRQADLLDDKRLVSQLVGLERRTSRGGRDSIDHGPNAHDDLINAAAGVLVMAVSGFVRRPGDHGLTLGADGRGSWDFRGPQPAAPEPDPYAGRDWRDFMKIIEVEGDGEK